MAKSHVKKGDEVVVIAGTEHRQTRQDHRVAGKSKRVIVEGVQMIKKHHAQEPATPPRRDRRT